LLVINLVTVYIQGKVDQHKFDKALNKALEQIKIPGLSGKQKEEIDNEVIKAFRSFGRVTK